MPPQDSQEEACDCVPPSKAKDRNAEYLLDFYRNYNDTLASDEHVQKTLGGTKWRGKEGALWSALHRKYPESIEIVGIDGRGSRKNPEKRGNGKQNGAKNLHKAKKHEL